MDALLTRFRELNLPHQPIVHGAVMTVEEQAAALQDHTGALTKNLFLKDKKGRLYIVTAHTDTKVNLKTLSARLGLGKGGLRMAPDDLLPSILQVPLGSVTPLAVTQPTAEDVVLLLDIKLQQQEEDFFVHPLHNTASLLMTAGQLEQALSSVGRQWHWVDLEADPKIDRENPPDLKGIADAAKPIVCETEDGGGGERGLGKEQQKSKSSGGEKKDKQEGKKKSEGEEKKVAAAQAVSDVYAVSDVVIEKVAAALGVDLEGMDGDVKRRLRADVVMELNALKNAAYSTGFKSSRDGMVASLLGQLS